MMPQRTNSLAAQRFAERRRKEDEAPKLSSQVPDLTALKLDIEERAGAGATKHTRRLLVDRAPALFFVPCGDPRCIDGGHDITTTVMRALRSKETSFSGSDDCTGTLGSSVCSRVLQFDAKAEYAA
jgi:hypothetical protein